jgi:RNA polymerase sigma-70 factor (ECF subfamily)
LLALLVRAGVPRPLLRRTQGCTLTTMDARSLVDLLAGERARFVRMARGRVATEADAEDVVQRAMMRASERAAQITEPSRARAWFYRILRRAIVDHHRSRPPEMHDDGALDEAPAPEPEPLRAPACRCAARLVGELRPAYAEVVRRMDFEAEDPAAVAAGLGISMTNLYVRLHRARRALRERVEGHCGVRSIEPCLECTCHAHDRCGSEQP